MPGLVDAHCHIGLDDHGATTDEEAEAQAVQDRDGGALLIRDAGSALDTRWIQERDDLPRLIRCGRHLARTKRYIRHYAHEVEPDELAAYAAQEAQRGDGWIKLVGDWISREEGDLAPSFPTEAFAAAIEAAHEHGAKVTAHCFGEHVLPGLIEAGIDCIEHGTGLSTDLIDAMVARGTALVPTVMQTDKFPEYVAAGAERFPTLRPAHGRPLPRRQEVILAAYDAGVAMYAGSDGGASAGTATSPARCGDGRDGPPGGLRPGRCVVACQGVARLEPALDEGAPADFVVYPRNPLEDLGVLREPAAVVLRGAWWPAADPPPRPSPAQAASSGGIASVASSGSIPRRRAGRR